MMGGALIGWEPIETAPLDREVWVCGVAWVYSSDVTPVFWQGVCAWDPDFSGGRWVATTFNDVGCTLEVEPTDWMNVPMFP
jgi:hypothetical protein